MQEELVSIAEKDLYICAEHRTNGEQFDKTKVELQEEKRKNYLLQSELKTVDGKVSERCDKDAQAGLVSTSFCRRALTPITHFHSLRSPYFIVAPCASRSV